MSPQPKIHRVGVLVVAAGAGNRFGGETPKQFLPLAGIPVAVHSIRTFRSLPEVTEVAVALPRDGFETWVGRLSPFLEGDPPPRFVPGGATRQESVRLGLEVLGPNFDLLAVHDAARPGATPDLIRRTLAAAAATGAAIPGVRPADTLWRSEAGKALRLVDRDHVSAAQTPQCFRPDVLREALRKTGREGLEASDEASVVRAAGLPVSIVEGSPANLKVTRPEDLDMLRSFMDAKREELPRVGFGFDAHRFAGASGSGELMLGGIAFPDEPALEGHSDGDALLHALTDAILGAVAASDIGGLFPSSDEALRGASSERFVKRALEVAESRGFRPGQVDLTIIAARPRLAPRVAEIRERLSSLLGIPPEVIGIKATTTDGMGFTGRAEGLAAQALVRMDPIPVRMDPIPVRQDAS